MQTLLSRHWHHTDGVDAARLLSTDIERGLHPLEAADRRAHFGPNQITAKKSKSPIVVFLLQFNQPLVYILLAAGAVTWALDERVDSAVILGVVLINAIIGFVQEIKAEKAIDSLRGLITTDTTVVRDGVTSRVPSADLVPGDVLALQSGDKIPADVLLVGTREFRVDESALTGESVPVEKSAGVLPPETPLPERRNMAYAGTFATYGQARALVVATGDGTETGRISGLIASAAAQPTNLTRKIASFSRVLLVIILALAALTFGGGTLRGELPLDMFMAAVALAVGAIPEGLPAAVTIILAIAVGRMAGRNAIIRRLPAVETLGGVTVICTDKTGTLTQNRMTVRELWAGGRLFAIEEAKDVPNSSALGQTLLAGLLCNDARVVTDGGADKVVGDPTEGALIVASRIAGMDPVAAARERPRRDTIPFESAYQYMATLHDTDSGAVVYVKGALERLLPACVGMVDETGAVAPMDAARVKSATDDMARRGLRLIMTARKEFPAGTLRIGHEDLTDGLVFLGVQAMIDPPRPEVAAAVRSCHAAGIAVKMITGDHALTAVAIASQLCLHGQDATEAPVCLTGAEIDAMDDESLKAAVDKTSVFARVTPDQKLRIVECLQARGHVAAMTGDGVNDAPALKRANIGIAMGINGTDVARESADMILADDNFATIEKAVEEGRSTFDNLTKFITWTLPTNMGEGLVILAAIVAGVTLPILPVQILWINMTTAVLLGLTLAFEPIERGILERPPRNPESPLLTGELLARIGLVSGMLLACAFGLFVLNLAQGQSEEASRTVAVNLFVITETLYLFNCRSLRKSALSLGFFSNPWVLAGVFAMVALQLAFTYLPVMNRFFHSAPIGLVDWAEILVASALTAALVATEKAVRRRLERAPG